MKNHRLFPYLMILGAGVIWGATFSLALIATAQGAHPLALSAWQVVLTAVFFLVVCLVSGITLFDRRNLRHYLVLALVGITLPNLFYFYAAPHLSAGILAITVSAVPLFTYAIMLLLSFESLVARRLAGIVLGMISILLLVIPDLGLDSDDAGFWVLLVVLCALFYAIENVYISRGIPGHVDIREFLFGSNLIAILIQFPLAIYLGVDESWTWLATDAGLAVVGIALGSGFAYSMFFYSIKNAGPVFASQCAYVVTISGVIWGIIVFSEQHTVWVWASVIVMLLGLVLVTPDQGSANDEIDRAGAAETST
ncbi:MAG: DMT family transporter [Gammaproteobacteria bacterium]|jgi:drug/metabolite transporter (DMT)-like permease